MAQVAQRAGVSLGTVSHVLNHPSRVTESTRERVLAAMEELSFHPSAAARTLAGGRSDAIGLVLTDLGNSLFVDVARGATREAEAQGMYVLLADGDAERGRELTQLRVFDDLHVAGSMVTLNDETHRAELLARHRPDRPLVLLNICAPDDRSCSVEVDHELGGRLATAHLLSRGRRRIAFLGGSARLRPVVQRRTGFLRVLAQAGLGPARVIEDPEQLGRADGYRAGRLLAADVRAGRVDAVFAVSDLMAAGVLEVLREEGLDVPGDVALVGYDDNVAAHDVPVPLTTLAQPGMEMGRQGARLVIEEARSPGEHRHEQVVLQPQLVVRASTGG
ncbi:LacI family DNA-binding transcriptional regulator [Brachybacterium hainanense]|uniref:LacI family DNA-binding transcriptional regulator n=1 Tax=Brachybacterium hainanense TaxID=1541174 RepID=A0ABV6R7W2_9MICO